jgi:hypothetical protein
MKLIYESDKWRFRINATRICMENLYIKYICIALFYSFLGVWL